MQLKNGMTTVYLKACGGWVHKKLNLWASEQELLDGYLMVDYNKVDVEFKKWHRK